jgi:CBS domain-containing protein
MMSLSKYTRARLVIQRPEVHAYDAARAMEDNHVGAVIVHDGQHVVGMVTDRDLALTLVAGDLDPFEVQLLQIMATPVVVQPLTASEADAAQLMINHRVRRIPIVDGERVVGLVTLDDLLLEQALDGATVAAIVRAQLEEPARLKRRGAVAPGVLLGRSRAMSR